MNSVKKSFQHGEWLLHEQSAVLSDLKQTLERLADKHGSWTDKFAEYKVENFSIIDSSGVVHNSPTQYIDTQGRVNDTPLHYMTACSTIHDSLTLSPVSERHLQELERELSKSIHTSVWEEKKQIQLRHEIIALREQCEPNETKTSSQFTRIEYAYSAVSISGTGGQPDTTYNDANSRPPDIVSLTTSENMDLDAAHTKIASNLLHEENVYKSALDLMNQQ